MNEVLTYEALKADRDALERQLLISEAKCKGYFSDAATALIKCDALDMENATLKDSNRKLINEQQASWPIGLLDSFIAEHDPETPATDAALAAVLLKSKIEGVEAAANRVGIVSLQYKPGQKQELIKAIGRDVLQYAIELREAK